jgi:hypothetical protein
LKRMEEIVAKETKARVQLQKSLKRSLEYRDTVFDTTRTDAVKENIAQGGEIGNISRNTARESVASSPRKPSFRESKPSDRPLRHDEDLSLMSGLSNGERDLHNASSLSRSNRARSVAPGGGRRMENQVVGVNQEVSKTEETTLRIKQAIADKGWRPSGDK